MSDQEASSFDRPLLLASACTAAVLLLTSAHHLYAARRFATPWRAHVVHLALWAGGLLALALLGARLGRGRRLGRLARGASLGLVLVVAAWLGVYEGGYNHVAKVILHPVVSDAVFARLFPPPVYEPPLDMVFEMSGVLQCPLALCAGWQALHGLRRAAR